MGKLIKSNKKKEFIIGVEALPNFPKDTTDRNRTSPFAFTGNKFEFRSLGSADSISCANLMLNTIVAHELCQFADRLEKADDFTKELNKLLAETLKKHKRVIFNGNNYAEEWVKEAEKRGLKNYPTTVDCLPHYGDDKNIEMFEKFKIFTKSEVQSRYEILIENYSKLIQIEAHTMVDMAKKEILPAGIEFTKSLCDTVSSKKSIGLSGGAEEKLAERLSFLTEELLSEIEILEEKTIKAKTIADSLELARFCKDEIIPAMNKMRLSADEMETIVPEKLWPFPTYGELLFGV